MHKSGILHPLESIRPENTTLLRSTFNGWRLGVCWSHSWTFRFHWHAQVRHHASNRIHTTREHNACRSTFNRWHFRAWSTECGAIFCYGHAQVWHYASDRAHAPRAHNVFISTFNRWHAGAIVGHSVPIGMHKTGIMHPIESIPPEHTMLSGLHSTGGISGHAIGIAATVEKIRGIKNPIIVITVVI